MPQHANNRSSTKRPIATWVCLLFVFAAFQLVSATSYEAPPFTRAHAPANPSLRLARNYKPFELTKRQLIAQDDRVRAEDTFLLRFEVDSEPFSVVYKPVDTLIHPQASLSLHSQDSSTGLSKREQVPLQASDVRAYEGTVVHEAFVEDFWNEEIAKLVRLDPKKDVGVRGWSRLLLRPDDSWDGSMQVDGRRFHFKPVKSFVRDMHKRSLKSGSPELNVPMPALARRNMLGGNTVILRSQDVELPEDHQAAGCGSDASEFNLQTSKDMAVRKLPQLQEDPASHWLQARSYPLGAAAGLSHLNIIRGMDTLHLSPETAARLQRRQDMVGGDSNSSFSDSIGDTSGCPTDSQVVYIGVAADCNFVQEVGSQDEARTQILSWVNSVSGLYSRTFNVHVGVVELEVKEQDCPSSPEDEWNVPCDGSNAPDLNARLSLFSEWRGQKGGGDGAGLWHLVSTCSGTSEVGVAWLSQLCRVDASSSGQGGETVSGTGVTTLTDRTWEVMAHEIGHNFGAIHDCPDGCNGSTDTYQGSPCCPLSKTTCSTDSQFIMSPVSRNNVSDFSDCSIGNVCTMLGGSLNTTCLESPGGRQTLSAEQCGNGILEPGEDCDPGDGGSDCCTDDCKLRDGAQCDPENKNCCTDDCQIASSGKVCRPSINDDCDPEETCDGQSADCPDDKHEDNGTSCGDSGDDLQCADGKCTSKDQECRQQGSSMGITEACSQSRDSCEMTCASPQGGRQCVILGSYFSDGLPCGLSGTCQNGSCSQGDFTDRAAAWIRDNKQYSIPIIVVGSIIILIILFSILRCCCGGGRRRRQVVAPSAAYAGYRRNPGRSRVPTGIFSAGNGGGSNNLSAPPYAPMRDSNGSHTSSINPPQQAYQPPTQPPPQWMGGPVSSSYAPPPGPPPPH